MAAASLIHIKTPVDVSSGFGTEITDKAGNSLADCVRRLIVTIDAREVIRAEVDMFCSFEGTVPATFFAQDPISGQRKAVSSIRYTDGTEWSAEPAEAEPQPQEAV
jgi:hypothetical protein